MYYTNTCDTETQFLDVNVSTYNGNINGKRDGFDLYIVIFRFWIAMSPLRGLSRKSVVRLTGRLEMSLMSWLGGKTSDQSISPSC